MHPVSKDQTMAVMHGTKSNQIWEPLEMPQWPFDLPEWVKDCRVDWMVGYSNRPKLYVLCDERVYEGEWLYEYFPKQKAYIAKLDDRLRIHYHSELLSEIDHEIEFVGWGQGPGIHGKTPGFGERLRKTMKVWATGKSQGYGGRGFQIKMADGRDALLRGPWHGCPPTGYQEVTIVEDRLKGKRPKWVHPNRRKWMRENGIGDKWDQSGTFGIEFTDELVMKLLARFQPHLRLAKVRMYGMEFIEPRIAGQAPKNLVIEGQDLSQD